MPDTALGRWWKRRKDKKLVRSETERLGPQIQQNLNNLTVQLNLLPMGAARTQLTQARDNWLLMLGNLPQDPQQAASRLANLGQETQVLTERIQGAVTAAGQLQLNCTTPLAQLRQAVGQSVLSVQQLFANDLQQLGVQETQAAQAFNAFDFPLALQRAQQVQQGCQQVDVLIPGARASAPRLADWCNLPWSSMTTQLDGKGQDVRQIFASERLRIEGLVTSARNAWTARNFATVDNDSADVYRGCKAITDVLARAVEFATARSLILPKVRGLQQHQDTVQATGLQMTRLANQITTMNDRANARRIEDAIAECNELNAVYNMVRKSAASREPYNQLLPVVQRELNALRQHAQAGVLATELAGFDNRLNAANLLGPAQAGGWQKALKALQMLQVAIANARRLAERMLVIKQRVPLMKVELLKERNMTDEKAQKIADAAAKIMCDANVDEDKAIAMAKDAVHYAQTDGIPEPDALMCARVKHTMMDEGIPEDKATSVGRNMRSSGTATGEDVMVVARQVARMSAGALNALNAAGKTTVACRGPITEVLPDLSGELPRGWPKGMTWDNCPGINSSSTSKVVIGTMDDGGTRKVPGPREGPSDLQHGTEDLVGHESGHAFDDLGNGSFRNANQQFLTARTADLTPPQVQQGMPPGQAAMRAPTDNYFMTRDEGGTNSAGAISETFAESFAMHFGGGSRWPALARFWTNNPFGI